MSELVTGWPLMASLLTSIQARSFSVFPHWPPMERFTFPEVSGVKTNLQRVHSEPMALGAVAEIRC